MSEELKRSKIAIIMKIAQFKIQSKYNLKFSGETRLDDGKETLSSLQPKFKHQDRTFVQCRLLHKLLVTNQEEELLERREELTTSLLTQTCQYKEGLDTISGVSVSSPMCSTLDVVSSSPTSSNVVLRTHGL